MIYLASPYSHPDPEVRRRRFRAACQAAAVLIRQGKIVFSPIAHSHPMTEFGLPGDWWYWENVCRAQLAACDELYVLMLSGWDTSQGVRAELEIARQRRMPVVWMPWPPLAVKRPRPRPGSQGRGGDRVNSPTVQAAHPTREGRAMNDRRYYQCECGGICVRPAVGNPKPCERCDAPLTREACVDVLLAELVTLRMQLGHVRRHHRDVYETACEAAQRALRAPVESWRKPASRSEPVTEEDPGPDRGRSGEEGTG